MRKSTKGPTTNPSPLERGVPVVQSVAEAAKARSAHRRDKSSSTGDSFSRQHPSATLFQFFCKGPQSPVRGRQVRMAYIVDTSLTRFRPLWTPANPSILGLSPSAHPAARHVKVEYHRSPAAAPGRRWPFLAVTDLGNLLFTILTESALEPTGSG